MSITTFDATAIPASFIPASSASPPVHRTVLAGILSTVLFIGGFGLWAGTAPLDSAAVASGTVITESKRKIVQHKEGGIVARILVAEGTRVKAGDPLVRLDDTRVRSNLESLRIQYDELLAQLTRLQAERDRLPEVRFPDELTARRGDPRVAALLDGQNRLMAARQDSLNGQIDILSQRMVQLDSELGGLEAQLIGAEEQLSLIRDELTGVRMLVDKGLERRPRLLALQRDAASLEGACGEHRALIARAQQRRGETELQIIDLRNRRSEEVADELRDVQGRLTELRERLIVAADELHRTVITAPTAGIVMDLRFRTTGGVVGAGEPILDIVPADEALVIEAKVKPTDIDMVHNGLPAQVRLTAFKQRTTPVLVGEVEHVAADSMTDQRTGVSHYIAHVVIERHEFERAGNIELRPGMPADVMILTGRRTALEYLVTPLRDSFARAFRED
jgi:HlyD family type I secretion membrane fusion protein